MNKKLLFGIMSLAALTACTNDEFESQNVAQEASPVQFEVLNNDAVTRASMTGNKIVWNANDGDIFTLYHGGAGITGYENAIYTAKANEGSTATLTTPSMIKAGKAVMVWPADTTFRIRPANNLSIQIPAAQKADIENYIPYMSDQITIGGYGAYNEDPLAGPVTAWNTEGKDRKYPVFMRPMASQLIVKADYNGTDAKIAELEAGEDGIDPISVTSVKLLTKAGGADEFTTNLNVKWTAPTPAINTQWAKVAHNAWTAVTDFDITNINTKSASLETECLTGNASSKFLILPQNVIADGVDDAAVVVNTIYGKVFIGDPAVYTVLPNKSYYTPGEYNTAWYRYLTARKVAADVMENASATSITNAPNDPDANGKYKTVALNLAYGMQQTINGLSTYTHQGTSVVTGEPEGAATTRYVVVNLAHLDMSDLHIKSDKQLRDAARVWKKMNLAPVTVYLDGNGFGEFEISQKTIKTINDINKAAGALNFKVKPCQVVGEACNTIVITDGGDVPDIAFIADNGGFEADVVLKEDKTWNWKGAVKVTATGVNKIINNGTMTNNATATLKTVENDGTLNNIPFENAQGATWNITAGTLNVQFDVTNYGTVNIAKSAQYRQDGQAQNTVFINEATNLPERFGGDDDFIGTVVNEGVFATVEKSGTYTAKIHNYGLIEHADEAAKTYITTNQTSIAAGYAADADFTAAFDDTPGNENKIGRINLPYSNKDEDNVSISAALNDGFVSVTVDGEVTGALDATVVGPRVNYVIVKSGVTSISNLPTPQVKYLEIDMTDKSEIAWSVTGLKNFDGLMVLSDVNIKLGTSVVAGVTYLGSDMYVGGTFNVGGTNFNGYYGNTSSNVSSKYITY